MKGITPGMFGGKVFKRPQHEREDVQVGPNLHKAPPHPVETLVQKTMGKIPIEPNGAMQIDPSKIEYLKS